MSIPASGDSGILPARIFPSDQKLPLLRFLRVFADNPFQTWPGAIYHEPIHCLRVLGRDITFVMAPDLIHQVLVEQGGAFGKGEIVRRALRPVFGDSILSAEGARWRGLHRAAAPFFRLDQILNCVPVMREAAERTRDRWLTCPVASEIELAHEMRRTTFDVILATVLPGHGRIDFAPIERALADYAASTPWVVILGMAGAPLFYPGYFRARRARDYLKQLLAGSIAEARRREAGNDLLSLLIAATDPETARAMDDVDIRHNLLAFISAGHDTPASALTWTFYLLSLYPKIEQRVVDEIEAVTAGSILQASHIDALAYTKQVIQETMRLYPPFPLILRIATRDVELAGKLIRGGTMVLIPIYAVQRHHALWDDPDRFDPDRFRPEAIKARNRYAYLPFGAGPRGCIGTVFAQTETSVILSTLLKSVRLRVRPGYVPELKMRATLRPAFGMPMQVTRVVSSGSAGSSEPLFMSGEQ